VASCTVSFAIITAITYDNTSTRLQLIKDPLPRRNRPLSKTFIISNIFGQIIAAIIITLPVKIGSALMTEFNSRSISSPFMNIGKSAADILTTVGYNDEVAAAKLIADFAKGREGIEVVGGLLEGSFVDASAINQLSSLPSREELLAKLVGSINMPVSGFVNVLAGNLRGLVYALNAIKESKA